MLSFEDNIGRVNRVVARLEPEQILMDREGFTRRHTTMYVSLYIGNEQVALGSARQKEPCAGEFTTERSGLRAIIKCLEAVSKMKFKAEPTGNGLEEYRRADLTVVPFEKQEAGSGK